MEWRILFLGPVGAGKTQAIKTISDIDVVSTEEEATDETAFIKQNTTVAMDMGLMNLGDDGKIILYGAPGQERFDFMWEILLDQTQGIVVLVNHAEIEPIKALNYYMSALRRMTDGSPPPFVVAVTHVDEGMPSNLDEYRHYLAEHASDIGGTRIPVFRTDAREKRDIRNILLALTAMLEFDERARPAFF